MQIPIIICETLFQPEPNHLTKTSIGNHINQIPEHIAQRFSCVMLHFQRSCAEADFYDEWNLLRDVAGRGESSFAKVLIILFLTAAKRLVQKTQSIERGKS